MHRKIIFPPCEAYDENVLFFCGFFWYSDGNVYTIFQFKGSRAGSFNMAAPEKIVNVVSSRV